MRVKSKRHCYSDWAQMELEACKTERCNLVIDVRWMGEERAVGEDRMRWRWSETEQSESVASVSPFPSGSSLTKSPGRQRRGWRDDAQGGKRRGRFIKGVAAKDLETSSTSRVMKTGCMGEELQGVKSSFILKWINKQIGTSPCRVQQDFKTLLCKKYNGTIRKYKEYFWMECKWLLIELEFFFS